MNQILFLIKKHKYAAMSVVLIILLIVLIAVLFVFKRPADNNFEIDTTQKNAYNAENLTSVDKDLLSGDSRLLVVCNGDAPGEIVFMTLLDFKVYSETIIVTPLSAETATVSGTYEECYKYGGITMLQHAVEDVRQCKIDRYIIMDEDGFCEIVDIMGKVTVDVEEDYTYESSDKSYNVSMGENELDAPMLFSYVKLNSNKNDGVIRLSSLFSDIISFYMAGIETEDSLELFEDLSNCVNTDITISDYYSCCADIEHLILNNAQCVPFNEGEQ